MPEHEIYKFLKDNDLTTLPENEWVDKYSAPDKAKEIHTFFKENDLTSLDETQFYDKYLKKNDYPQNIGGSVAEPSSLGSPYKLPSELKSADSAVPTQKVDPIGRIKLYSNALQKIQGRYAQNVQAYKAAEQDGNADAVQHLLPQIKQDSEKAAFLAKAIEGQKKIGADNLPLGVISGAKEYLGNAMNMPATVLNSIQTTVVDLYAHDKSPQERQKLKEKLRADVSNASIFDPMRHLQNASDAIAAMAKPVLKKVAEEDEIRQMNQPYQGSPFEAVKAGDYGTATKLAASGFMRSLPTSLSFLNPATAAVSITGMVGAEQEQARQEKGYDTSLDTGVGLLKGGLELATERLFGSGKATVDLVKQLGKGGAEQVVRQSVTGLFKEIGKTTGEEAGSEFVNQIAQNAVDKYIGGKNVGIMDGAADAAILGAFGGIVQGGGVKTVAHLDQNARAKSQDLKSQSADLVDEALHQESPAAADVLHEHAQNLHNEAEAIDHEQQQIAEHAAPETVAAIEDVNAKKEELVQSLETASDTARPVIEQSIVELENQGEVLLDQAKQEAIANLEKLKEAETAPEIEGGKEPAEQGKETSGNQLGSAPNEDQAVIKSETAKPTVNTDESGLGNVEPDVNDRNVVNIPEQVDNKTENQAPVETAKPASKPKKPSKASNKKAVSALTESELIRLSKENKERSKEETAKLNQEFEDRQKELDKSLTDEEKMSGTIDEKLRFSQPLNADEIAYANENYFLPEGFEMGESGLVAKSEKAATKIEQAIDKINSLKIDTKNQLHAFGIAPAAWNAMLDVVITGIKAGKAIADAISDGIAHLKTKVDFDEKQVRDHLEEKLSSQEKVDNKKEETADENNKESESEEPGKKKRRFTQQFLKQKLIEGHPELAESLSEDTVYYNVLPNKVSLESANGLIDYLGVDEAKKAVADVTNGIGEAVRSVMGQIVLKRLQEEGDYDSAIDLLETLTKRATEMGQGIQALSMFQFLTPEGQLRFAQKTVNKSRTTAAARDKDKTDKVKEGLKSTNAETVDTVLKSPAVRKATGKTAEITPAKTVEPKGYGSKNKIITKSAYEQAKRELRGKLFSAVIPPQLILAGAYHLEAGSRSFAEFSKKMVRDFGVKVKPYLRKTYELAKEKFAGTDAEKEFDSEEKLHAEDVENLMKEVAAVSEKAKKKADDIRAKEKSDISDKLTAEELKRAQATVKDYNDRIKNIAKDMGAELKDMGESIDDIVRKHYTVFDGVKKSLKEKLVEKAGLTGAEAENLSKLIEKEFDKIATAKKQSILDKMFSKKQRKSPEVKTLDQKLIELTNLGAFSDVSILNTWAESMGYPKLTETDVKEIQRLSNEVQSAQGTFKKFRVIEDLLSYQANIKGVSKVDLAQSIWYSNILSGFTTQEVNFIGNIANSMALWINAAAQNPKQAGFMGAGFMDGLKRGWLEGKETFKTGYSPIRGKIDVPTVLERHKFTGWGVPFKYHKYVLRTMKAADVIIYEALKEMRAYQLAVKDAAKHPGIDPSQSVKDRAAATVGRGMVEYAQHEAQKEYERESETISRSDAPAAEKSKKLKQAESDRKRRVYEIVEESRPEAVQLESEMYASRGTYNYKPEGILGLFSLGLNNVKEMLNKASDEADNKVSKAAADTARLITSSIIPFTNIIANVANESLNYSPIGLLGVVAGKSALIGGKKLTDQQRVDLMTKALIGTSLAAAVYALATIPGDDDKPLIEITANGFGDYRKNYDLQNSGWQPYSIRVGNKWYSYQYTPLILILSLVGNIKDYEKYRGEKMTDNGLITKVSTAFGYTFKTLMDLSVLSSLNSFLSAAVDPRNEDRVSDLLKSAEKTAQSFVVPNAFTQGAKEIERVFDIPTKDVRNAWFGQTLQHVPVARDRYYDKINSLGEPVIPDTDKLISSKTDDRVWNLVYDKAIAIGSPSQKTVVVYDSKTGSDRFLTDQEFYEFSKIRGNFIKTALTEHFDEVNKMPPEDARHFLTQVKTAATKFAKAKLFAPK